MLGVVDVPTPASSQALLASLLSSLMTSLLAQKHSVLLLSVQSLNLEASIPPRAASC